MHLKTIEELHAVSEHRQPETQPLKLPSALLGEASFGGDYDSAIAALRASTALCHDALSLFVKNPRFADAPHTYDNHPLLSYGGGLVHRLGFEPNANLDLFLALATLAGRASWLSRGAEEFQGHVDQIAQRFKELYRGVPPVRTPPITLVAIPKSAGTFIAWRLRSGLNIDSRVITTDLFPGANIQPEFLREFAISGDGISHNHLDPTEINHWYLAESKISIIVQMRDLRAVVLSWAHHLHAEKPMFRSDAFYSWKFPGCRIDDVYFEKSFEWQIDYLIDNFLPILVKWSSGWTVIQKTGRVPILMTTFEDMLRDERQFFQRILEFYDLSSDSLTWPSYSREQIPRFRLGAADEWRLSMSASQKARALEAIPTTLFEHFGWQE